MTIDKLTRYLFLSTFIHTLIAGSIFFQLNHPNEEIIHKPKNVTFIKLTDYKPAIKKRSLLVKKKPKKNVSSDKHKRVIKKIKKLTSAKALKKEKTKRKEILKKKPLFKNKIPKFNKTAVPPKAIHEKVALNLKEKNIPPKQEDSHESDSFLDEPIPLDTKDLKYSDYFAKIRKKIEEEWSYPEEAAMLGLSGQLSLKFIIKKNGNLIKINIVGSSGHNILDDEAIEAIKEAAPYNKIPEAINRTRLPIIANFNYFPTYDIIPVVP